MDYRIEQLRYQLREDPSSRVFYKLGEQLRRKGEVEEASAVLRGGLDHHPRYVAAWVALGRSLRELEDSAGAMNAFSRARELDGENVVAARALAELAADREDWAEAARFFDVIRADAVSDSQLEHLISRVDGALEEEAALLEAASEVPVYRPPAEVVSLSADDPFAGDGFGEDDDEGEQEPQDVFGLDDVQELGEGDQSEDAPPTEEPAPTVFADEDGDEDQGPSDVGVPVVAAADPFDGFGAEDDAHPTESSGFESWADVAGDDDGAGVSGQVDPPVIDETTEIPDSEVTPEATGDDDDPERPESVPEIAEPDLDWDSDTVEESEVESWADVADDVIESVEGTEERLVSVEPVDPIGDTYSSEPIIPDTLAQFDQPTSQEIEEEPVAVAPEDVPLPTLTFARLAVEQGDTGLAEATLSGLLERDPGNVEARDLLGELKSATATDHGDAVTAKVAALRGWLDTIRLASERHSS